MRIFNFLAQAFSVPRFTIMGGLMDLNPSLKKIAKGHFLMGVALNQSQFTKQNITDSWLIKSQFNSISPENVMKWENIHPVLDHYNFGLADRYVEFGEKNGMFIVGHPLIWHSQIPNWVFQNAVGGSVDRNTLLARMRDHITTVVSRYQGRINGWDVVNGVMEDDGSLRQTPWLKIIGRDYIAKAFAYARAADPKAGLYFNDYGLENSRKRAGTLTLIRELRREGVPITGIGIQEHSTLEWPPTPLVDRTISDLGKLGLKVMITELDVNVLPMAFANSAAHVSLSQSKESMINPYSTGLPNLVQQQLAKRYADLFAVYLRHPGIVSRVTLWGLTDGDSWLNNWPINGRINHPLLFDRFCQPKAAYSAVLQTLSAPRELAFPQGYEV